MDKMVRKIPPTPPRSHEPQYTYQPPTSHVTSAPFYAEDSYQHSTQPMSTYMSPTPLPLHQSHHSPSQSMAYPVRNASYADLQGQDDLGLGLRYMEYQNPVGGYYLVDNALYSTTPSGHVVDLPLTPKSTDSNGTEGKRDRNDRFDSRRNTRADTPIPRATKPRARRAKAKKTSTSNAEKLKAPLSELTSDLTDVPVKDMRSFVNRSAEVRRQEVEARRGYVTRPMNSFMLYRSAYAERTKIWCGNNHQIVSQITGQSWPLESTELRQMYMEFAEIERTNHAAANPNYKFCPSKNVPPPRKKKSDYFDDEVDDFYDSDDDNSEYRPNGHSRSELNTQKRRRMDTPSSMGSSQFGDSDMARSSWEIVNDSKPLPTNIGSGDLFQQYYQSNMLTNTTSSAFVDLPIRRANTPSAEYGPIPSGLPGVNHPELLQLGSQGSSPAPYDQVNPMLLGFYNSAFPQDYRFQEPSEHVNPISPGLRFMSEGHQMYGEAYGGATEPRSHFDDWMGEHGGG